MFIGMAATLDAPTPRALPDWLIRLAAPYVASIMADTTMRVSNAKAKSELGWMPDYTTLHEGLSAMKAHSHPRCPTKPPSIAGRGSFRTGTADADVKANVDTR